MSKRLAISTLIFLICAASAGSARQPPVRDGFGLTGVDGKLIGADGKWSFEFDSEVSEDIGRISTGSIIDLLPSITLEKMTADAQKRSTGHPNDSNASYRLWGSVTKYRNKNFIFPIYFLPVSTDDGQAKTKEPTKPKVTINEPNDVLAIPEEIVGRLRTRRVLRQEQLKEGLQLKQDYVLVGRTALLDKHADGKPVVVLDAIGRNIQQVLFRVLPCRALERAQYVQSLETEPVRFKIAGILTQYKGEYYLFLQKATRAYSHENFGR
jgi:hypothetical protein